MISNKDEELYKILIGAIERGNLYEGYVASAEFDAEAAEICDVYLPMLKKIIHQENEQAVIEELSSIVDPDNVQIEYDDESRVSVTTRLAQLTSKDKNTKELK